MSNDGGHAYNLNIGHDLRLSLAIGEPQGSVPLGPYTCSYCKKSFTSLQALGGHQTAHRKEIEEMRREHEAYMDGLRLNLGQNPASSTPPNNEERSLEASLESTGGEKSPEIVDYIGLSKKESQMNREAMDGSSEETMTDPQVQKLNQDEMGEEVSSVNLELTLGPDEVDLTLKL